MDWKNFLVLVSIIFNFILALVIHFRGGRKKAHLAFEFTILGILGWCVTMFFYRMSSPESAVFWARWLYFFPTFIPTGFVVFGLLFPNHKLNKKIFVLIVLANLIMAWLTLQPGAVVIGVRFSLGEKIINFGWAYYYGYIIYIPVLFSLSYLVLFKKYRRESAIIRQQILYIILGLTGSSTIGITTNLILPTFGFFELNWLGQVTLFIWVGSVTYAIVKHRLMDIRLVVARTVAWALLVFILEVFYTFLILSLTRVFYGGGMNSWQIVLNGALTLITAVTFHPLRRLLERITDSIFFKDRYDTEDFLKAMGRILGSTLEIELLANKLLTRLLTEMKLSHACLVSLKGHKIEHIFSQNCQQGAVSYHQIRSILTSAQRPLIFDELPEGKRKNLLRQLDIGFVAPLRVKDKEMGILVLGHKLSGDIYFDQDIQVLSILTSEVAVAIQNALSYEEIKKFSNTLKLEVDKATLKIKNTNKRLKELSDLKDEFVSVASHEMRTPMTIIKGYLSMLLEGDAGKLSPKAKDLISDAFEGATRMIRLVNNMLNVSRIESGRISVNLQDVQLEKICEEVVDEFRIEAREHGLKLKFETLGTNEPLPKVRVDIDRIREVLVNLVANAIKFTPHGHIFVRCQVKDDLLLTEIEDTGVGIPKEARKKLFRKFSQASLRDAQERKGSGLGLYICQLMINEFGGKIWFNSKVGKGTTFFFVLPTVKSR
ncbi:hypothetical protein KKD62_01190 [Patescibacteria group bacterium]|nr:hypothetical protein [Patescibacteria group bacterium]MBU1931426.1 hypothetical protein [Patescibacteria group bacterium]